MDSGLGRSGREGSDRITLRTIHNHLRTSVDKAVDGLNKILHEIALFLSTKVDSVVMSL
jgi:hypothetical protein